MKEVLSRPENLCSREIKRDCILLAFLATPHHGSRAFSKPNLLMAVNKALALPQVTGRAFMEQMLHSSRYLEALNQRFSYHCLGIPVWTHSETEGTLLEGPLDLLASDLGLSRAKIDVQADSAGLKKVIVDKFSSELRNNDHHIMVDEEDWEVLPTDHNGAARLADDNELQADFIKYTKELLNQESLDQYRDHRALLATIFEEVQVEQHILMPELLGERAVNVEVETSKIPLKSFIESGPNITGSLRESPIDTSGQRVDESKSVARESIPGVLFAQVAPPSERRASIASPAAKTDQATSKKSLAPPASKFAPKPSSLQRRISMSRRSSLTDDGDGRIPTPLPLRASSETAASAKVLDSMISSLPSEGAAKLGAPPKRTSDSLNIQVTGADETYDTGSFKWFHVSHCVPNWVPLIMNALAEAKKEPGLYRQVLKDEVWMDQHNNPTHDSFHGKFVHPFSKELIPKDRHGTDELLSPSSATKQPQFVLYFPYL